MDTKAPSLQPQDHASQNIAEKNRRAMQFVLPVIILFLIAGSGGYYLGAQSTGPLPSPQLAVVRLSPTTGNIPTPMGGQKSLPQTSITPGIGDTDKPCRAAALDVSNLPISVDQNVIKALKVECIPRENNTSDIQLTLQNRTYRTMENFDYDHENIYIDHEISREWCIYYGLEIGNYKNLKVFISYSPHSGKTFIGDKYSSVYLTGVKEINMRNGKILYAAYPKVAIEGNDSRLVEFLKPYSKPSDTRPGQSELAKFPLMEIKNKFFSDLSSLQQPEKSSMEEIEHYLSAIVEK